MPPPLPHNLPMDNDSTSRTRDTLPLRLATAAVGIPLLALCVWLGSIPLLAITAAATFLGIWELRVLLHPLGRVLWPLSALIAAAFLYSGHTADISPTLIALTVIGGGSLGAVLFTYRTGSWDGARSWTTTIGASIYPAALLATGLALRESADGLAWLTYAILITFASDTAAYATGSLIGRHKLSPSISPGKTWEGAAGAVIGAAAISAAFAVIVQLDGLPVSQRHPPRSRDSPSWAKSAILQSPGSSGRRAQRTPARCSPDTAASSTVSIPCSQSSPPFSYMSPSITTME